MSNDERQELYLRKRNIRQELRERCIPRDLWGTITGYVEDNIRTVKALDEYLDQTERDRAQPGQFL